MTDSNPPRSQMTEYALAPDENPTAGVWSVVARLEDCSPVGLPPLTAAIDADALDTLLTGETGPRHVSFEYHGYEVTATSDAVRARPLADE